MLGFYNWKCKLKTSWSHFVQISHTASSKTLRNVQRCDASLSINDLFCDACFARNPTVEKLLWKVDSPEMSKKDNCGPLILAYLNEKNRPYSAQDVFCNLQKQHGLGKTAVVKAMELLALEGKIKEKTYGKQKIYFADQAQFKDVNDADLKAMDSELSELSAEAQALTQSCRQLDAELKELNSSLTTEEMISEIHQLKAECSGFRGRLQQIKSATNHVTPEEKEKVNKERSVYVKEWKKRKRLASDMINAILEGYPKSKKEFLDEVGVETDEDCKVVVPSI